MPHVSRGQRSEDTLQRNHFPPSPLQVLRLGSRHLHQPIGVRLAPILAFSNVPISSKNKYQQIQCLFLIL